MTTSTADVVTAFNEAFNSRRTEAVAPLLTQDCVFDGTTPPDGDRHTGREEVLAAFSAVFDGARQGVFTSEELIVVEARAVVRWRYDWIGHDGVAGHVRRVDVIRVRDGAVAEKISYVKG